MDLAVGTRYKAGGEIGFLVEARYFSHRGIIDDSLPILPNLPRSLRYTMSLASEQQYTVSLPEKDCVRETKTPSKEQSRPEGSTGTGSQLQTLLLQSPLIWKKSITMPMQDQGSHLITYLWSHILLGRTNSQNSWQA